MTRAQRHRVLLGRAAATSMPMTTLASVMP